MKDLQKLHEELDKALTEDRIADAELLMAQIEAMETGKTVTVAQAPKEAKVTEVNAGQLGLEAVVEPTKTSGITKEQLGVSAFEPVLAQLTLEQIKAMLIEVADADDLLVLLPEGTPVDAANRIHVTERGDVYRAARGMGLYAAGAVEDGYILSNSGRTYEIRDGVCIRLDTQLQLNSDSSTTALIKESPCLGHLEYKNVGVGAETKFVATGGEHMRCAHQWAAMFAAGYFVTVSKSSYYDIVLAEIASRVGDKEARAAADALKAGWAEKRQDKFEVRKAHAQVIAAARNDGRVLANGRMAPFTDIVDAALPDGSKVGDAVKALKGNTFVLKFRLNIGGKLQDMFSRKVSTLQDLADAIAPTAAIARNQGQSLEVLEVIAK